MTRIMITPMLPCMWLSSMRASLGLFFLSHTPTVLRCKTLRLTLRDGEPKVCHNQMPCMAVRWQAVVLSVGVVRGQNRVCAERRSQGEAVRVVIL